MAIVDADTDICGETFDHTLDDGDTRDGITVYSCRRCGAEIIEEEQEPRDDA